jgi:hypothetical protein
MVATNCFVCLSRSYFDRFLVLYQINGFCQHSQSNFSSSPTFRVSKIAVILNLLVTLSMVFPATSYLLSLKMVCTANRSLCLILIADQIYIFSSIFLEAVIAVKIETIHQDTLSWLNIFENREFYGLGDIVDEKKLRKFVIARSGGVLMIFCGMISGGMYLFSNHAYDNLMWSYARKVSLIVASTLQAFILVEAFHRIFIMGNVLEAMKKTLRKNFNRDFNLFKKQVHLISVVNNNTRLLITLITVLLIVWILTTIIFLIFNIYALTDHASHDIFTIILTQVKTSFSIMGVTVFFYIHDENIKKKVSLSCNDICLLL